MELLEFARGPALQFSIYALVIGTIWRVLGILLLQRKPDYSEPRKGGGPLAALSSVAPRA